MKQHSILAIDHDVPVLQALAVRLRSEGFEVRLAQDGERALSLVDAAVPDLLIVDGSLPGSGGSLVTQFGQDPRTRDVPMIRIGGDGTPPPSTRATLPRRCDAETLIAAMREALGDAVRAPRTFA